MNFFLSSAYSFSVRIFGAFILFLLSIFVSRELGVEEAGYYFLVYASISVLAGIAKVGLDEAILKFIGISNAGGGAEGEVKTILFKAVFIGFCCSSLTVIIFYFSATWISVFVFKEANLVGLFKLAVWYIPLFVLSNLLAVALQGTGGTVKSVIVLNISTSVIVLIGILLLDLVSAKEVIQYLIISVFFSCVIGVWFLRAVIFGESKKGFTVGLLFTSALPLWGAAVMTVIVQWSGQLILGGLGAIDDVALLAAAQRTSMLVALVLTSVNLVVAPKFASLYSSGDMEELSRLANISSRATFLLALPALLLMIVFPEFILSIYGTDFGVAATALQVLAIGQFVNAMTGPVGYLMSMSGHEQKLRNITFLSSGIFFLMAFILIPLCGLIGAAFAISIGVITQNFLACLFVKRHLGLNILPFL